MKFSIICIFVATFLISMLPNFETKADDISRLIQSGDELEVELSTKRVGVFADKRAALGEWATFRVLNLPNIKEAKLLVSVYSNVPAGRVMFRLEQLTTVNYRREKRRYKVNGWINGEDGEPGFPGIPILSRVFPFHPTSVSIYAGREGHALISYIGEEKLTFAPI